MYRIAVLICGLIFDSQKKIINGIKNAATEKGCHVFVFTCMGDVFITNEYTNGEFSIFSLPDFKTFDGIILAGNTIMHEKTINNLVARIKESKTPTISIDNKIPGFANIHTDNKNAVRKIVEHLIHHHNYKRIVFLAGPKANIDSQQRLEGYLEAMKEANIEVSDKSYYHQDFTERSGEKAASYFLDNQKELPEAIVCANDLMAISTADVLLKRNIKIPEQIAITGFDYTEDSIYFSPQITSVKRFQEETGYQALLHLYNAISGNTELEIDIEINTEVVFSTSCGCPEYFILEEKSLRKMIIEQKTKTNHETSMLKQLYTKSIALNNHDDFYAAVENHFSNDFIDQFYFCTKKINNKKDYNPYSFTKNSVLSVSFSRNRNIESFKNIKFKTIDILPKELISSEKSEFYYVMPVHSIDLTIGYVVIDADTPLKSELFYTSILNLGLLHENIENKIKLKNTVEQLANLWIHDSLTGLYNRNGFINHSKEIMDYCLKNKKELLVLFIDLDNLKYVNDTYGHYEGDYYLKAMSKILVNSKTNIKLIMRYGGDEFVIFSPGHTEESTLKYIESINMDIKQLNSAKKKPYKMEMSIGYVLKKIDREDSPETLISLADNEMYLVKNNKKKKL